jgi:hypothetical protein
MNGGGGRKEEEGRRKRREGGDEGGGRGEDEGKRGETRGDVHSAAVSPHPPTPNQIQKIERIRRTTTPKWIDTMNDGLGVFNVRSNKKPAMDGNGRDLYVKNRIFF